MREPVMGELFDMTDDSHAAWLEDLANADDQGPMPRCPYAAPWYRAYQAELGPAD